MADCKNCKRTDIKCCPTCARNPYTCNVWHRCEEDCKDYEPRAKTQGDKFRSMSDEELAEFLDHGILDVCESFKCEECENRMNCDVCYLEWLKSEVEE